MYVLFLFCRYILWKLCASVIVLNIILGIVIKSYFSAVGFSVGASASAGDAVGNLIAVADANNVSTPVQLHCFTASTPVSRRKSHRAVFLLRRARMIADCLQSII
jgi:hypothetical protein